MFRHTTKFRRCEAEKFSLKVCHMQTQSVTGSRALLMSAAVALSAAPVAAGGSVDKAYVKSLARPGQTVLVIEYYDGGGAVVDRKGFASALAFKATSPTDFQIDKSTSLHLYGLEPCDGEMVNQRENFSGRCSDYAIAQLQLFVKAPKVIFCRAFLSEEQKARQDVTCFGYYNYPGSVDAVDNIEEQLVSLGALRVAKKPDATSMRPDLVQAERIGRKGYGMWADPRIQRQ
jgi:hypothetical protein